VGDVSKADTLQFRSALAKLPGRSGNTGLSAKTINRIIQIHGQILAEAGERYEFPNPVDRIKRLKQQRVDIHPFTLAEVRSIIEAVRADYRQYFIVRFFTGLRTGELHGLQWRYVDFDRRQILVRRTLVRGELEYTKTDGSQREVDISQPVFEALRAQQAATGRLSPYVFCNAAGDPIDLDNFTNRVWYPLLRHLGLDKRRPYQTRHTAATLWLGAGENPEWVARQLGHANTEMLFKTYSRFVPNLTRRDGSAMERLLAAQLDSNPTEAA
jgi:integrase